MEVKLTFVGDVLMDGIMAKDLDNYRGADGKLDFHPTFEPMRNLFEKADFVLANLETPITDKEEEYTSKRFQFGTAYEFAEALHDVGIDYVSTANNHCLDRGVPGLITTVRCLDQIGLLHSGVDCPGQKKKRLIADVGGLKIGILSYTYGTNAFSNKTYLGMGKNRKLVNLIQEQEGAVDHFDPFLRYIRKRPRGFAARLRKWLLRHAYPENAGKPVYELTTFGAYRRHLLLRELRDMRRLGAHMTAIYLHVGGQYNVEPSYLTRKTIQWLQKKKCNIIIGNHEHVVHGSEWNLSENQVSTYAIGNFLGSAGIEHAPYDRYAEYSIAVHTYLDVEKKALSKVTFSVLAARRNEQGTYEVWPVADLIRQASPDDARKLTEDCFAVAKLFSGQSFAEISEEYLLCKR